MAWSKHFYLRFQSIPLIVYGLIYVINIVNSQFQYFFFSQTQLLELSIIVPITI